MRLLDGVARKVSIPIVMLSICGWIVYLIGFALFIYQSGYADLVDLGVAPAHRADINQFPHWCFLITGPVLFISTFIHLVIGRWFTGIFAHFLTGVYLVMGGGILYSCGLLLFEDFNEDRITEEQFQLYLLVEWVGATASVLFLTIYMLLWPTFTYTDRGLPEGDVHVSPTPAHIRDPVTYRPPSTTGQTMLDQPPMYPAEGEAWAEMKSPIS